MTQALDPYAEPEQSISFDGKIPDPTRFPSAPDELVTFIETYHRGLSRVSVGLWGGRKRYAHVSAIVVGAKYDELPRADTATIVRAVMAIAQDKYEEIDQSCKFRVQVLCYKKATGDAVKRACHIELGTMGGSGDEFSEGIGAPEQSDQMAYSHINECHRTILEQAKVISQIGREAIANTASVFVAKEEAIMARADAERVSIEAERDTRNEEAKNKRWSQGFQLLKSTVNSAIGQAGVAKAQAALGIGTPAAAAPGGPVPTTATPGWVKAASGETPPAAPVVAPPQAVVPLAVVPDPAAPAVPPVAELEVEVPAVEDVDFGGILDPEEHGLAACAASFFASLTGEQWPQLFEAFTKPQINLLLKLKAPETDDEVKVIMGKFQPSIKPDQQAKMMVILDMPQITTLIQIGQIIEAEAEEEGED